MSDIKAMYRTVMADHFPPEMTISFGDQKLVYRKRTWKLPDAKGDVIEMGLRYGENPGQEAALYELVGGNLTLGECHLRPQQRPHQRHRRSGHGPGGQAPGQNQPHGPGQRPEYHQVAPEEACGGDPQTQQPLRRRLGRDPGRGLRQGQPGGPHRRLRRGRGLQPAPGQGHRRAGLPELPGGGLAAPDFEAGTLDILKKAKDLGSCGCPASAASST